MGRMVAAGLRLRPMHASGGLAGVAITVRSRTGDTLLLHKAIDFAGRGDVIVVESGGELTNSLMEEMVLEPAVGRGAVGLVLDGADLDTMSLHQHTNATLLIA